MNISDTSLCRCAIDLIPDPLVFLKADGSICDVNSSCVSFIGIAKEHLIGQRFCNIEPFKKLEKKIEQSIKTYSEDVDRITYNNRQFDISILPFKLSDGSAMVRIIFKDISNFTRLENELLKRNKELIIINTLSSAFISSENIDIAIEDLLDKVLLITDFHTGWFAMREGQMYKLKAIRGASDELITDIKKGALNNLFEKIGGTDDPLHIIEYNEISRMPFLKKEGFIILIAIPLISQNMRTGFLFLASKTFKELDFDFAALLSLVGNHVSHIIEKIRLFQETRLMAITDGLTGLYNSRYFYKSLEHEMARINRYGGSFSVILFDIDYFKALNDTYGHQAGDEVLQELARILKTISRETDVVVRYGGEEFIIILPNTSEEETVFLANRIRDTVQKTRFKINEKEYVNITLSGGIASYPKNAFNAKTLLAAADTALYSAKAAGKNTIFCYQGKYNEKNL